MITIGCFLSDFTSFFDTCCVDEDATEAIVESAIQRLEVDSFASGGLIHFTSERCPTTLTTLKSLPVGEGH